MAQFSKWRKTPSTWNDASSCYRVTILVDSLGIYIDISVNQILDLYSTSIRLHHFVFCATFKMCHYVLTALTFIIWDFPIFYAENFNYSSSKNVGIKLIPDCGCWYGLNGASSFRNTKIQYLTLKVDLGILIKPLFISTFPAKIHFDA